MPCMCGSEAIVDRKEWSQCRACGIRYVGKVILPDRGTVENGQVYVKRKDTERRRNEMYELMDQHPESADELVQLAKDVKTRLEVPLHSENIGAITGTSIIEHKRGSSLLIPNHYLPPRMWRMWKRREMTALEAYGAAMYVYFTKNQWMIWGGRTNYRVEFVSGSMKLFKFGGECSLQVDQALCAVLDYCLIEEGRFADVPGVDYELQRTARHHQGKEILSTSLRKFARKARIAGGND